jgi:hypothetical protein
MAKSMALIALFAVLEHAHSLSNAGSDGGKSEPACLLQSTFASTDLSVDAEGEFHNTEEAGLGRMPKMAMLFETDALEESILQGLKLRSTTRSRSCKAHLSYLERKMKGFHKAHNVSDKKIDEVVQGFISKQSGSEDACSSQLMEAKHQLNQVHQYVSDLALQVNHTEHAILALNNEMEAQIKEMEKLEKWREDELELCEKKKQEYIEMYTKLSAEMEEMKQIASPGVAMDVKTGELLTADSVGLMQMTNHTNGVMDMKELQLLLKGTKSAAQRYMTCVAHQSGHKEHVSQLQELAQQPKKGKGGKGGKGNGVEPIEEGPPETGGPDPEPEGLETGGPDPELEGPPETGGPDPELEGPEGLEEPEPETGGKKYDCKTKEKWNFKKTKWCCENEGICKFDCKKRKNFKNWNKFKQDYCCDVEGICGPGEGEKPMRPGTSAPVLVPELPIEKHVDPPELKPISVTVTAPPKLPIEKHVDPPELKPTSVTVTVPPKEKHVDPPELKPTSVTVTVPPPEKHVDPPELKPITIKPVPVPVLPTHKHVDPPGIHRGLTVPKPTKTLDLPVPVADKPDEPKDADVGDLGGDDGIAGDDNDFSTSASEGEDFDGAGMSVDALRNESDQAAMDAVEAIKNGAATPEKCEEEKKILEETYIKTYVELSRLKDEYNEMANSTACEDNVESLYKSKKTPIQEKIDGLNEDIDEKIRELQNLRPRLESATDAEKELRKHVATLTEECSQLPETVSNLDKVRDAIEALSKCPGLSRVQFSLPKWTGTWVEFKLDAAAMTDEEQDAAMDAACAMVAEGTRAAEIGEIAEQTVEGIPVTNTAELPLIGTCPHCQGDEASELPSGHKRICWRQGKDLTPKGQVSNCATGSKALLCVTDREDFRQIPGEA